MNKTIEEFEKWLLAQEKPAVEGEMTLGKINEYRTHMCKHAFEGGFNAAQALMSQGEPVGYYYAERKGNGVIAQILTSQKPNPKLVEYGTIFDVEEVFLKASPTEANAELEALKEVIGSINKRNFTDETKFSMYDELVAHAVLEWMNR